MLVWLSLPVLDVVLEETTQYSHISDMLQGLEEMYYVQKINVFSFFCFGVGSGR